MDEKQALEFLTAAMDRRRQRKPTTAYVLIGAAAWIATLALIGKAALLLVIPAFLIVLAKIMEV